ncbi:MAG TPA: glycosyltransferase, partial [Gemmatimonadales bacterium]|nr:glycosyltransferase [Gemmatimonadales bacterium]
TAVRAGAELVEIRLPPRSYRREIRRVAAELGSGNGAIAHTHGLRADLVGLRAARLAGAAAVSTIHGFTGGDWKTRLYEWLDLRTLRSFDAVAAVSRPIADRLRKAGVTDGRVHVIPNSHPGSGPLLDRTAARRRLEIPPDRLVAGWVGRLSSEKGPDLFLDALAQAPDWHGSILGSGPLREPLLNQARRLGLGGRATWHGTVPGAGTLLRAFDTLVLSSRTEGTPVVLLEAMAAGVPTIVTRVGGVPDMVTEREAILVPPGDSAALARALGEMRADPAAAAARARAAEGRQAAAFALDPWLDRYEALYRSVRRDLG